MPSLITAISSAPSTAPTTDPEPPVRLVPPMMAEAMTTSSKPTPVFGLPLLKNATAISATSAQTPPMIAVTTIVYRRNGIPEKRPARLLLPIACNRQPNAVWLSSTYPAAHRTIITQTLAGRPRMFPPPTVKKAFVLENWLIDRDL